MTHEQKINYLRIAFQLQDIGCTNEMCDTIVTTYERLIKKKGKFSISDAVDIKFEMQKRYPVTEEFDELDQIENDRQ